MKIIEKLGEMKALSSEIKASKKRIGFVPTMGALHKGQLSLIDVAQKETEFIIVSIFVNPLQFGTGEDFKTYPKVINQDIKLLEEYKVNVLFTPEVDEMYPEGSGTYIEVPELSNTLCGLSRPEHFKGVCTVVCKLFNIINPSLVVFGEKDAQQVIIIKRMVQDLNMRVKILIAPTVRASDGLALSSRNIYLNEDERKQAPIIYQSLIKAQNVIKEGERDSSKIKEKIKELISKKSLAKIDYIDIVKKDNLKSIETLQGEILIAVAVRFGKARLIDNITVKIN